MMDRKIDYESNGVKLEVPEGAKGFKINSVDGILYYHYGEFRFTVKELLQGYHDDSRYTNDGMFPLARSACICEAVTYWMVELRKHIDHIDYRVSNSLKLQIAGIHFDAWLALLDEPAKYGGSRLCGKCGKMVKNAVGHDCGKEGE